MKKLLVVIAAVLTIGVAALAGTSSTEQAYDTWQPEPMMMKSVGKIFVD